MPEAKAPREAWALFRTALPLADAEIRAMPGFWRLISGDSVLDSFDVASPASE
jgi:hypothetical protein